MAIDLQNALHVRLHTGAGEDGARLKFDLTGDPVVIHRAVSFQDYAVDDRVLLNENHHRRAVDRNADIGEQVGAVEGLDRQIDQARIRQLTRADQQIGQDRVGFDTAIAFHLYAQNRLDSRRFRLSRRCSARLGRRRRLLSLHGSGACSADGGRRQSLKNPLHQCPRPSLRFSPPLGEQTAQIAQIIPRRHHHHPDDQHKA